MCTYIYRIATFIYVNIIVYRVRNNKRESREFRITFFKGFTIDRSYKFDPCVRVRNNVSGSNQALIKTDDRHFPLNACVCVYIYIYINGFADSRDGLITARGR